MSRVYNFSAGPAVLPEPVLKKAQEELFDYKGTGMSVMEMSHRGKEFTEIIQKAEADLRALMKIPSNYKVLFLQGGASSQFAMVPMNLFSINRKADYVKTGEWAKKAIAEAKRYGKINVVASSEDKVFSYIPELKKEMFDPEADYFHITTNNTIYGTTYPQLPETSKVPLVADMSSNILGQDYDVTRFGLIYAGAQKNIGPAGLTIVIIREDLLGRAMDITPVMFNYKIHADGNSLYNTPPCFPIYIAGLVFEWMISLGGVPAMEKINREKAAILYKFLDQSKLFKSTVKDPYRSIMNVPFVLPSEELNDKFIKEASKAGLKTLKGHRTVGGMRASIYNAMPKEGLLALTAFMKDFEKDNG
ncbi:MAG TPA: 3-phosphoserine/phosphohydroxythreonine transaminase [Cyclobacteriaceae bacterium]|nr:3-phosphoserine/phosphohydroxythreonine transaminase [Cyclobacteriaceae bacterium]